MILTPQKILSLTAEETAIYDAGGEPADKLMRAVLGHAQDLADACDVSVHVYTYDGIVLEAVSPRPLEYDV